MTSLFSDRYKLSLILSAILVMGIGASLYTVYTLPSKLQLAEGYEGQFTHVYLVMGGTFVVGALTLLFAMQYKKEVVVFRDRALEAAAGQHADNQEGQASISLESIHSVLNQDTNEQDKLQHALHSICKQIEAGQGALYWVEDTDGKRNIVLKNGYALSLGESTVIQYEFGEGLIGQSAASGDTLYVDDIPEGYVKIISGLGSASPRYILIAPIKQQDHVLGILELATFSKISEGQRKFVEEAAQGIADKVSIKA